MWNGDAKRRIFFDMHFPDWPERQTSTAFDPVQIAETFAASNVDSVILYAKCQFGNFYYDTELGHKHSGLGSLDLFRETMKQLHGRNISTIAYYSVAWDEFEAAAHPEWLVEGPGGERDNLGEFRWSTLCINSPYREVVKAHLREISAEVRPDGYWLDMTIIGGDRCFCPHCRALYQKRFGKPLTAESLTDEQSKNRFIQFRYDYIQQFYDECYTLIRQILPEAQISNNYWGYPYSSWTMGSRAIGALKNADYLTGEAYTDWTGLSAPGFFSKFLRGVGDGRPYEALIGRFCGTWDYTAKPGAQLALEAYTIAAAGGVVTIDDEPFADGSIDAALYSETIAPVFAEIKRRERWLGGAPVRFAAILHSQLTKDYFLNGKDRFIAGIAGAYRLLRELQCPTEFLFDESLTAEKLRGLKLIFLPNVAVMDEKTARLVNGFAKNGGLVIAAGETGIYRVEQEGLVRDDSFLQEQNVVYRGVSDDSISYISLEDCPGLSPRPVTVRSPYVRYECAGAALYGRVMNPICETKGKTFFHNNLPAPYDITQYPAVFQTGNFVFFAQDVFSQFAGSHQLEIKALIGKILKNNGKAPQITFQASSNIEFFYSEMEGKTVLHFVNFTPGMGVCCGPMDTFEGRYQRTFEFVEHVNPIHGFTVWLPGEFSKITALSSGEELSFTYKDGKTEIALPRLYDWETLLLEP